MTAPQPSSEPQALACANAIIARNHTLAEASRGLKPRGSVQFVGPALSYYRRGLPRIAAPVARISKALALPFTGDDTPRSILRNLFGKTALWLHRQCRQIVMGFAWGCQSAEVRVRHGQ